MKVFGKWALRKNEVRNEVECTWLDQCLYDRKPEIASIPSPPVKTDQERIPATELAESSLGWIPCLILDSRAVTLSLTTSTHMRFSLEQQQNISNWHDLTLTCAVYFWILSTASLLELLDKRSDLHISSKTKVFFFSFNVFLDAESITFSGTGLI